jgi:co-chaperonin GroES (HSP10)
MAFVHGAPIRFQLPRLAQDRSGVCGLRAGVRTGDDVSKATPANDRVLVQVNRADSKTPGGLLLASDSSKRPMRGVIIAVPKRDPAKTPTVVDQFGVGDKVMWPNEYVAETVQDDEERIVSVRVTNISAKW